MARIEIGLLVSRYKLKTVSFRYVFAGQNVPQIGCIGDLTLDGSSLTPADRSAIAALVDLALYCGTGHHTTMGMGQTRVTAAK
jgi:CRISPR/Cas system endoribonuclease Cas6 (RAMP superfamily)